MVVRVVGKVVGASVDRSARRADPPPAKPSQARIAPANTPATTRGTMTRRFRDNHARSLVVRDSWRGSSSTAPQLYARWPRSYAALGKPPSGRLRCLLAECSPVCATRMLAAFGPHLGRNPRKTVQDDARRCETRSPGQTTLLRVRPGRRSRSYRFRKPLLFSTELRGRAIALGGADKSQPPSGRSDNSTSKRKGASTPGKVGPGQPSDGETPRRRVEPGYLTVGITVRSEGSWHVARCSCSLVLRIPETGISRA